MIHVDVSSTRRALSTNTIEQEKEMSGAYMFFFAISQLGGLYAFLIVVLGFLVRPIYDKWFQQEAVNTFNLKNKLEFTKMEVEWKEKHQQLKIEEQKGENDPMSKMRQFSKSVVHSSEKKSRQDTKERSNSKLQKGATMKQNRKSTGLLMDEIKLFVERYQDPEYSQRAQQKGEEWNQKNKSSKSHLINKEEARNNRFQKDKNYMMRENQKTQFYK